MVSIRADGKNHQRFPYPRDGGPARPPNMVRQELIDDRFVFFPSPGDLCILFSSPRRRTRTTNVRAADRLVAASIKVGKKFLFCIVARCSGITLQLLSTAFFAANRQFNN
jgi:hypothetical protein